jgi:hypothetical protein
MRIVAYCTQTARHAVRRAVGVEPLTSPPLHAGCLPADWADADFVYVRLHGRDDVPDTWFGESDDGDSTTALTLDSLPPVHGVWLLANCYSAESPWPAALYRAGASAVIAGSGPNYAASRVVIGTDLLARWLRYGLSAGLSTVAALRLAKTRLFLSPDRAKVNGHKVHPGADARAFKLIRP